MLENVNSKDYILIISFIKVINGVFERGGGVFCVNVCLVWLIDVIEMNWRTVMANECDWINKFLHYKGY